MKLRRGDAREDNVDEKKKKLTVLTGLKKASLRDCLEKKQRVDDVLSKTEQLFAEEIGIKPSLFVGVPMYYTRASVTLIFLPLHSDRLLRCNDLIPSEFA